jgi:hypothetical protein
MKLFWLLIGSKDMRLQGLVPCINTMHNRYVRHNNSKLSTVAALSSSTT